MTRRALITGGAGEIGRATAERLRADGIEAVTADITPGADVTLDVTDAEAAQEAVERLGEVDILVNTAGVLRSRKPATEREWRQVFAVNLHGLLNMCQAAIPGMLDRGWGRIVNVASPITAVMEFTRSLGEELAATGVVVNAIAPAVPATLEPHELAELAALIPVERSGRPAEIAELVAWLASESSDPRPGTLYDITERDLTVASRTTVRRKCHHSDTSYGQVEQSASPRATCRICRACGRVRAGMRVCGHGTG